MKQRILVTGSSGFIGGKICEQLKINGFDVIGIDKTKSVQTEIICDLKNSDFATTIEQNSPDVIIHSAAIKSLYECEHNKISSWITNVGSTNKIVQYSHNKGIKVIFISSDVIFDGLRGSYDIDSLPNPINWYGETKLHSELLIKQLGDFAICRTALVIGDLPNSYLPTLTNSLLSPKLENQTLLPHYVFNKLIRSERVALPSDIISNPTPIDLLCLAIINILNNKLVGTFHTTGPEAISRYEFAKRVADFHHLNPKLIVLDNANIDKIRPNNLGMLTRSTYKALGLSQSEWTIDRFLNKLTWTKV